MGPEVTLELMLGSTKPEKAELEGEAVVGIYPEGNVLTWGDQEH